MVGEIIYPGFYFFENCRARLDGESGGTHAHIPVWFVVARVWGTVLGIGCGEWGGEGKRREWRVNNYQCRT